MKSNASLISFLTISDESEEKIFFMYLKAVEEIAPPKLHWYNKRGQNGNANFIWKDKKLKHWCLIGNDFEVNEIFKSLVENKNYSYEWTNKLKVDFTIPQLTKKDRKNDFMLIDSICPCGRNEYPEEYICQTWTSDISFLINEKNNCNYIEGYKKHRNINSIKPYGLYSENFIYDKLKDKVCAVLNGREVYYVLNAERNDYKIDPIKVHGFIQSNKEFREKYRILIKDVDGLRIIGESNINTETGIWSANLSEPAGRGQFLIQNKENGNFHCGEKFVFIKNIEINPQIIDTVLIDLYGREISISGEKKIQVPIKDSVLWDSKSAPDSSQAEMELSDKLTTILLSLGKQVVFNDPYFIGDFSEEDNKLKISSKSQHIFLNALITAIAKGNIEHIVFIGSWNKAKSFIKDDKEALIKKYKLLYQLVKHNFKKSQHFKIKSFELVFSEQPFHDRYWANINIEENLIYHVSNSINGAFESGELRITLLDDIESLKIKPRIQERLKNIISLI